MARLISYIHHTNDSRQYCHVGTTARHRRFVRFQSQPQGDFEVYLEVEHLSLSVACARSKHQYPTVLQNLKLSRWMLDNEWTDSLLLISGICSLNCCVQQAIPKKKTRLASGNWQRTEPHSNNNKISHPSRLVSRKRNEQCPRSVEPSHVDHVPSNTHTHSSQG